MIFRELYIFLRQETTRCNGVAGAVSRKPDVRQLRHAQSSSGFDQRLKHGLQIEGRAADDLEHVRRGGLLLQRLAQLVEQARVLDRDDRLGGKVREQINLLVGER